MASTGLCVREAVFLLQTPRIHIESCRVHLLEHRQSQVETSKGGRDSVLSLQRLNLCAHTYSVCSGCRCLPVHIFFLKLTLIEFCRPQKEDF